MSQAAAVEEERWTAPDEVLKLRKELAGAVGTDLKREEQESSLSFFADDDRYQFTTYVPALVRKALAHDYARINWVYIVDGGEQRERVEDITTLANLDDGVKIEGIQASLPLGCLLMKGLPRKRDQPSSILKTPERSRRASKDLDGGDE
jgi:hypothetical protein